MKTLVKKTKTKVYIDFNGEIFATNHDWTNFTFLKVDFGTIEDQQSQAIKNQDKWVNLGDFETIEEAYSAYLKTAKEERESRKKEYAEFREKVEKEQNEAWEQLSRQKVIPATVKNIKTLLLHLNKQNWGTWRLPKLSIGYTANQYDCEGKIATTIKLDEPISDKDYGIEKENKFKVGGKRGHLNKYQSL